MERILNRIFKTLVVITVILGVFVLVVQFKKVDDHSTAYRDEVGAYSAGEWSGYGT